MSLTIQPPNNKRKHDDILQNNNNIIQYNNNTKFKASTNCKVVRLVANSNTKPNLHRLSEFCSKTYPRSPESCLKIILSNLEKKSSSKLKDVQNKFFHVSQEKNV